MRPSVVSVAVRNDDICLHCINNYHHRFDLRRNKPRVTMVWKYITLFGRGHTLPSLWKGILYHLQQQLVRHSYTSQKQDKRRAGEAF